VRAKGQGALALMMTGLIVAVGVGFDRLGEKAPAAAPPGAAPSGAWFCPHGGGNRWATTIYLANPGTSEVTARLTSVGPKGSADPVSVSVPAGGEVARPMPDGDRASSTLVEYFGGWIAAGWVTLGGGAEGGAGAEPCAPDASTTWYTVDNTTQQGQQAYIEVMNPFGADAVFDVVLYTADRAPIRFAGWTDITLGPHRSEAFRLNDHIANEVAVMAEVDVSSGRVAAASIGLAAGGSLRSALAIPALTSRVYLPVGGGPGQSQIAIGVPGESGANLGGTLLSQGASRPVPGLVGASQDPQTARVYPLITSGPATALVQVRGGALMAASLRAVGPGKDEGATSGATGPAVAWIVTPTVVGHPFVPGLILANPGSVPATVKLHLLAPAGAKAAADVSVDLPAGSVVTVPTAFLASAPVASVLATSDGPPILALGVSSSLGNRGLADYALAMGIPIPAP
jgi:hypothetical protein